MSRESSASVASDSLVVIDAGDVHNHRLENGASLEDVQGGAVVSGSHTKNGTEKERAHCAKTLEGETHEFVALWRFSEHDLFL